MIESEWEREIESGGGGEDRGKSCARESAEVRECVRGRGGEGGREKARKRERESEKVPHTWYGWW